MVFLQATHFRYCWPDTSEKRVGNKKDCIETDSDCKANLKKSCPSKYLA